MDLLTSELRDALLRNTTARAEAYRAHAAEPDPAPVVKFFNPVGAATWVATELDPDGDTLFGLAIERDEGFSSVVPLSLWADVARNVGSIISAEAMLRDPDARLRAALDLLHPQKFSQELPPTEPEGG